MTCKFNYDKEGKVTAIVCSRGNESPNKLKKAMSCRTWELCERCVSFETCKRLIKNREGTTKGERTE